MSVREFKINNHVLPSPNAGFTIEPVAINSKDSGRTLSGTDETYRVRYTWNIKLSWSNISDSVSRVILGLLMNDVYVNLTYLDPYLGTDNTSIFKITNLIVKHKYINGIICYWDISCEFEEK